MAIRVSEATEPGRRAAPTTAPHIDLARERAKDAVRNAAAALQLCQSEVASGLAGGDATRAELLAVGDDINPYIRRSCNDWHELLSVQTNRSVDALREILPVNRSVLGAGPGRRMVSIFDADGTDVEAQILLAQETVGDYRIGFAPTRMKIVDRRRVILQGPWLDGDPSIMGITSGPTFEAAWRYWHAVHASSVPAAELVQRRETLTARQQQIVALLGTDLGDEAIAAALGVSVRTVRSDVAAVLDQLGVRSRFAAGLRLRQESSTR